MEAVVKIDPALWRGVDVLLTGHTGFKGAWLAAWLSQLGAKVHGYALDPPTDPNLFEAAHLSEILASDVRADLRDFSRLRGACVATQPEVIFHLAAQPLVRESYRQPLDTLAVNITGTAHLLEAARSVPSVKAIVVITTDKVYEKFEAVEPHSENDRLGGRDPYSASKAAAEIVVSCYRASFFSEPLGHGARIATTRAGNVIGGGDWARDRLVPDCIRAFSRDEAVQLRFPNSVRPWQHVLEPLAGYILLAQRLLDADGGRFASAWNFGPDPTADATADEVARIIARLWGGGEVVYAESSDNPPEAAVLRLDSTRARTELGWRPRWGLEDALARTADWHRQWIRGADMGAYTRDQIDEYGHSNPA